MFHNTDHSFLPARTFVVWLCDAHLERFCVCGSSSKTEHLERMTNHDRWATGVAAFLEEDGFSTNSINRSTTERANGARRVVLGRARCARKRERGRWDDW